MAHGPSESLTPREREVIELVKQFWKNAEIARHLKIKERTVETHVANALHKLGYASREDLWEDMIG